MKLERKFPKTILVCAIIFAFANIACADLQEREHLRTQRMAAWHSSLVSVNETVPNTAILTYVTDRPTHTERYMLSKIIPFVSIDGISRGSSQAKYISVDDFLGYVQASYYIDDVKVEFQVVPLMVGRDSDAQQGAVLYKIKTTPPTPLEIHCGGGELYSNPNPKESHQSENFSASDSEITIGDSVAILKNQSHKDFNVAISSAGKMEIGKGSDNAKYLCVSFAQGRGDVVVAFSHEKKTAPQIASLDGDKEFSAVKSYYDNLLSSRIETPEKVLDEAFNSAIYNLEYNWYKPIGWVECFHHWVAMFHMQHTAAAEWLDQIDRSRLTTLAQAYRLHPDGAAPDMFPGGQVFHAFGGTNQYFTYQVSRFWDFTADEEFLEEITPYLDRVIAQTYQEYDPDNNFLLEWKSQIGQQEDYLHHPYNSATPSIESINIMRTRKKIAHHFGDNSLVQKLTSNIAEAKTSLFREFWDPTLGRFLYYKDPLGKVHLDAQYETYAYPVIYDILDKFDSYTNLRHLRDTLTGAGGEVYCSNNYPNHINGTWGMQAGAAQQPIATTALAKMGLRNEAYKPIKAIASWVMNEHLRGSWPEISVEEVPAYFSPPAAVYVQSVVEAIFGLEMDKPNSTLKVSPSFPDHWPNAKLHLPRFNAEFARKGNKLFYSVQTQEKLARKIRWLIPPAKIKSVKVNGKKVKYKIAAGVNCLELAFTTDVLEKTNIEINLKPINYEVKFDSSIALGESFNLNVKGCEIIGIEDRSGVLANSQIAAKKNLTAKIGEFLLRDYEGYGRLGQITFSRRTFFIHCDAGKGLRFWYPVDLTILPKYEAMQIGKMITSSAGAAIELLVRNNTEKDFSGTSYLDVAGAVIPFDASVLKRSQSFVELQIPAENLSQLSPGENYAKLILPSGKALEVAIIATNLFVSNSAMSKELSGKIEQIELPNKDLVPAAQWKKFRRYRAFHHPPWLFQKSVFDGCEEDVLSSPKLPVDFKIADKKLIPVSWYNGKPDYSVDLGGRVCKKLYLLIAPYLDSHDIYSPVARVVLTRTDGRVCGERTLRYPGDLDSFSGLETQDVFATARILRDSPHGLLPLIGANESQWGDLSLPAVSTWFETTRLNNFPQPAFWATCLPLRTKSAVLSIVEIDLRKPTPLDSINVSTIGTEPAIGIVAVTVELEK